MGNTDRDGRAPEKPERAYVLVKTTAGWKADVDVDVWWAWRRLRNVDGINGAADPRDALAAADHRERVALHAKATELEREAFEEAAKLRAEAEALR